MFDDFESGSNSKKKEDDKTKKSGKSLDEHMKEEMDKGELKPLPENLRKKVEELRKKWERENVKGTDDQESDIEIARTHKFVKEQDLNFFNMLVEEMSEEENPEMAVSLLKKDFEEYVRVQDEVYKEKGGKTSAEEVRSRLKPDNLFVYAILNYGKKFLGDKVD